MDGISFLRGVKQDYVQYNVCHPINMSGRVYRYRDEEVPNPEDILIYKGWAPTIEISTRSEYEIFKKVNGGSDYRADDDKVLFCLNDRETIADVLDAVDSYYITAQYENCIDDLISALEPKKRLELYRK